MIVNNAKISPFTQPTRTSRGITVLFDHRGEHLVQTGAQVHRLRCHLDDPRLELYRALESGLVTVAGDPALELCAPIPSSDHHVTFADLFHAGNVDRLSAAHRSALSEFLTGLPHSLMSGWPAFLDRVSRLLDDPFALRLTFDRLHVFEHGLALVALLKPADEEAALAMVDLEKRREAIDDECETLGKPRNAPFRPHVTLAYLPNAGSAKEVLARLDAWKTVFEESTRGLTIEFRSASLFAFTSMADFRTLRPTPAALCITADALNHPEVFGAKGGRKVVVSRCHPDEGLAADLLWRAQRLGGRKQVALVQGLELAYFNHTAAQDRHLHRICTEIYTVLSGGPMVIEVEGHVFTLSATESIIVHPGAVHRVHPSETEFVAQVVTVNARGSSDKFVVPDPAPAIRRHFTARVPPLVPNVTLVAYYNRPKPSALQHLIDEITGIVSSHHGSAFAPYRDSMLHATWIGLEAFRTDGRLRSVNAVSNKSNRERPVDFEALAHYLRTLRLPLTIQFGSFGSDCACDAQERRQRSCHRGALFHSCDRSAYAGSFYAFPNGAVVLTGWALDENGPERYPSIVSDERSRAERAGFVDKFHFDVGHPREAWKNDDVFVTLGHLRNASVQTVEKTIDTVRQMVARRLLHVPLGMDDLAVVKYRDTRLAQAMRVIPVADIDGDVLESLYSDVGW